MLLALLSPLAAAAQEGCTADRADAQRGISSIATTVHQACLLTDHDPVSPEHHSFWSSALHVADTVAGVGGLAIGGAALLGVGAPVVVVGGAVVGGYFAGRATYDLVSRWRHHQTLNPLHDAGARGDWLSLGASAFGAGALASGARTIGSLSAAQALGVSAGFAGLAMIPDGVISTTRNWGRMGKGRRGLAIAQLGLVAVSMGHDRIADQPYLWQATAEQVAKADLIGGAANDRPGMMSSFKLDVRLEDGRDATLLFKPASGERDDFPGMPEGTVLPVEKGTYYRREVAAYRLSKVLGYHFVPPTVPVEVNGEVGSAQLFVNYSTVASDLPRSEDVRATPYLNEYQKAQLQAFDYLIGNFDRHSGNWLLGGLSNQKGRVIAIDHGLSFPKGFPDSLKPVKLPVTVQLNLDKADPVQMASTLLDAGIEPDAVEGVLGRWMILRAYNGRVDVSTEEKWQEQVQNVRSWMKQAGYDDPG